MTTEAASPAAPRRRLRRGTLYAAWGLAAAALLLLIAVGLAAISVAHEAQPAHDVLEAQFTTSYIAPAPAQRDVYDMWTDATRRRVRLTLLSARQTLYYQRGRSGAWYVYAQRATGGAWSALRLSPRQQPSALSLDGVRRFFAALQRKAVRGTVERVGLRGRLATAFLSQGVMWPFPAVGPTTVWLDGVTGLPMQFRAVIASGAGAHQVFITTVDRLRSVRSTTLSYDFFTPPTANSSPWDRFVQLIRHWLHPAGSH